MITAVGVVLAALSMQYCRLNGWTNPEMYHWGCYSDVAALWSARELDQSPGAPFNTDYANFEYPALTMILASLVAWVTHGLDGLFGETGLAYWEMRNSLLYWDLTFLLAAAAWFVLTLTVMKAAGNRPWDALIVATSPAIIFGIGINWDIFPAAALALAILFYLRRQWVLAGVFIGIGVSLKLYPLFLLGAAFTLTLRAWLIDRQLLPLGGNKTDDDAAAESETDEPPRPAATKEHIADWVDFARLTLAAVVSWLLINIPVMLVSFESWLEFYEFSASRAPGWSSLWQAWGALREAPMEPETVSVLSLVFFTLSCAAVLAVGLTAPVSPRMVQLLLLIVAAFMIFNKVYSPQFMMWLLPLIALAAPRWRDVGIWTAAQVFHFWVIWMHLAARDSDASVQHLLDERVYLAAVAIHMLSTLYICAVVLVDIYQPQRDVIRQSLGQRSRTP
ncbi:hypothetical protein HGQ17_10695 [Nesterenkonia sp. MY13]|uniref:DUF2029 domain-containing protein n=1 Tax=Nesterenkonia sedimenti TaxID=1463632 RepID=A0A7X8YE53_9MICC|nr:hypothetical protein [Nesterenkonia sedimenti]NLS10448.1 hypothetical protein [Nesterenkonia sedimenti]